MFSLLKRKFGLIVFHIVQLLKGNLAEPICSPPADTKNDGRIQHRPERCKIPFVYDGPGQPPKQFPRFVPDFHFCPAGIIPQDFYGFRRLNESSLFWMFRRRLIAPAAMVLCNAHDTAYGRLYEQSEAQLAGISDIFPVYAPAGKPDFNGRMQKQRNAAK